MQTPPCLMKLWVAIRLHPVSSYHVNDKQTLCDNHSNMMVSPSLVLVYRNLVSLRRQNVWCPYTDWLILMPVLPHWLIQILIRWVSLSWASCQIRKIAGAHAPGMPGTFSPSPQLNDPEMHHGTCVTHVPWCMPGSLTSSFLCNRRRGKTFPAFPAHAQPAILRIW